MLQIQSFSRGNCVLLVVLCGKHVDKRASGRSGPEAKWLRPSYPFPELSSSGRLEVHTLFNPTPEQFLEAQRVVQANFLYIQGQQLEDEKEIGSLVWGTTTFLTRRRLAVSSAHHSPRLFIWKFLLVKNLPKQFIRG